MSDVDMTQAGAIGDAPTAPVAPTTAITKDTPVVAKPDLVKDELKPAVLKKQEAQPNVAALTQRWTKLKTFKISTANAGKIQTVTVKPSGRTGQGEDIGLPFRRNVWVAGEFQDGFFSGVEFKITSTRAPQFVAIVELKTLKTADATNSASPIAYHTTGGAATTLFAPFSAHSPVSNMDFKELNRHWTRASAASASLGFTPLIVNRTSDANDCTLTVYVRLAKCHFSVPIKPRKRPVAPKEIDGFNRFSLETLAFYLISSSEYEDVVQQQGKVLQPESVVPKPGVMAETGQSHPCGDIDFIDQDEFWVKLPTVVLKPDEAIDIPYSPFSLIQDMAGPGGDSVIYEKMCRYANMEPRMMGNFGPSFGKWRAVIHTPTTMSGQIAHITLPGDMQDEVATLLFGLDSILGVAGSILTSVGGPLLTGAISTVKNAVKDIPIVGDIANVVGDIALGAVDSILPSDPIREQPESNPDFSPQGVDSTTLSGNFELPRHIDYVKTVDEVVSPDMLTGHIIMQLLDAIGVPDGGLKAQLYASIGDMASFARNTFEREIIPSTTLFNFVVISREAVGFMLLSIAKDPSPRKLRVAKHLIQTMSMQFGPAFAVPTQIPDDIGTPSLETLKDVLMMHANPRTAIMN